MDIYKLDVMDMPTNLPVTRNDARRRGLSHDEEKNEAIIALIEDCHERGQPMLVGTTSIEKSEQLSELLKKRKIKHNVLNARYHEQEAAIVAQAGVPGTVTIATNMAGRGTDIQLGGNARHADPQRTGRRRRRGRTRDRASRRSGPRSPTDKERALAAGGLYVLGTERHESRRIDNQLRGRTGRQGDPGASKFFLSCRTT